MESKAKRIINMMEGQLTEALDFKKMKQGTNLKFVKGHPQAGMLAIFHSQNPDGSVMVQLGGNAPMMVKASDLELI